MCDLFSKRADEIAEYLEDQGYTSYRSRNVAARTTRKVKRYTGTDELMLRWVAELESIGWSVDRSALPSRPPASPTPAWPPPSLRVSCGPWRTS